MEDQTGKKKLAERYRVNLTKDAFSRVVRWADQIKERLPTAKIKSSEVADYILQLHSEELSNSEIQEFRETHVSEIDLAKWAIKQIQDAKIHGQSLSLEDVLGAYRNKNQKRERRKRKISPETPPKMPPKSEQMDG